MDFSRTTVLCVGDVMIDRYMLGEVRRISPEAPVPVLQLNECRTMLGGAGNVARNIAALGGKVVLIGLVGNDAKGEELTGLVTDIPGIIDATVRTASRPTSCKSRVIAQRQQVIRIDDETTCSALPTEQNDLRAAIDAWIETVDAVILSDYGKGVLAPEFNAYAIDQARKRGLDVFVDPKSSDFTRYAGATCITPNLKELAAAAGSVPQTEDEIADAAHKLLAIANCDAMLVTRSEEGMMLVTAKGHVSVVPARALEVFDISGAGDTAIATFALACANGQPMPQAMRIANLAAGIVVGKTFTATVSREELAHALDEELSNPETASSMISRQAAANLAQRWKRAGLKVGFTNGCFDVLHAGHVSLLRQARSKCDRLVVGLNTDASVKRLKGAERPLNVLEDRASVLSAVRFVDAIVSFHEDTPRALIEQIRPDVLIKGSDYSLDDVVGADIVKADGGSVFLADLVAERSTTDLISRIRRSV
jgi:D-beta-D-heptose 7-phosphate kinase/D-beta-D-heptose 1-phosphate adenosyltransferase